VAAKRVRSALDGRTTRHATYQVSLRIRKRIESIFGWLKTVADWRKIKLIGTAKVAGQNLLAGAAYILCWIGQIGLPGPDAPPRQAPAYPHRHAGTHVPGRPHDPHRRASEARLRLRLPGGAHLSPAVHPTGMHLISIATMGSPRRAPTRRPPIASGAQSPNAQATGDTIRCLIAPFPAAELTSRTLCFAK
jgi:hypothetical protein